MELRVISFDIDARIGALEKDIEFIIAESDKLKVSPGNLMNNTMVLIARLRETKKKFDTLLIQENLIEGLDDAT